MAFIRFLLNSIHFLDEETGENKPDYPELNGALKTLKQKVKEYYNSEIVPVLFEYQFLK